MLDYLSLLKMSLQSQIDLNLPPQKLLFLEAEDPERDVYLYINSPGGGVYAGLAIYDTIQHMKAPVSTVAVGIAASMGAILVAAGAESKRSALPNARIMIHQPSGGSHGTASDIEIQAKEILSTKERLTQILAQHTGQKSERIDEDIDRDRFMSAEEAVDYGLIDQILEGPLNIRPEKDKESNG